MTEFTPLASLVGGLMIGTSAALLLLANGRIAGISGIAGGLLTRPPRGDVAWRAVFLAGLLAGGAVMMLWNPGLFAFELDRSLLALAGAGLLVGFGTRLGNGCTSGHGVCGISRFSVRSIAATGTFMVAGVVTVFVVRHFLGGVL
ncbi:MAG: YeeE/YedE family protein [Myxococcota bacterium]